MEEDTNAGTSGGGSFRFDFFGDGSGPAGSPDEAKAEAEAVAPALPPPLDPGPWGREALLLPAHVLLPGAGAAGQPERVRVMWEESVGQYGGLVAVEMLEGDRWRKGRVRKVAPWRLAASSLRENPPAPPTGHLEEHDLIFHDQHHRHTPAAPPLGPSLASLIYPVLPGRFLREIYGRKALAVHELGGRVEGVLRDLNVASGGSGGVAAAMAGDGGGKRKRNRKRGVGASYLAAPPPANATDSLDVAALLRAATRTVVWMRAQDGGREMQYLEVPPEVAWACYRAGHSLYFNPPLAFQRPYVIAVLRALGMGMGVGAGAEDGEGGLGGDVEVFAVRGPHVTPWHFDAQDNITIQLRGCKRWRLKPSGLPDPLTNLHPASASTAALQRDRALHVACSPGPSLRTPPPITDDCDTVLLRPGSVLYTPCGWWHQVESLGDHPEGSLSINLSLDPRRWAGLLHASLGPALWGAGALRGRARRVGGPGTGGAGDDNDLVAATRAEAGRMLEVLRERLAAVAPADLLPLAAFDAGVGGEEEDDDEEEDGEWGGVVVVEVEQQDLVDDDRQLLLSLADDGDDDDDDAEARARARGSYQACAGLSKRAGWPQDSSPGARAALAAGAAAAGIALVRSPLAALVLAGIGPLSQGRSLGCVAAALHSGFPLDMSPSPAVTVRIEAPPVLLHALAALARLGPGERTSVQGVADAAGLALEGEQALLLWKLVGVLVYHGYLRPDK